MDKVRSTGTLMVLIVEIFVDPRKQQHVATNAANVNSTCRKGMALTKRMGILLQGAG